jgi:putative ABC transport system ATP-binding protein
MLNLSNISVTFNADTPNEVKALDNFSLNVQNGEFITVIGANGAGKSTLFNVIAGTTPVDHGSVMLASAEVTDLPEYKRSRNIRARKVRHECVGNRSQGEEASHL